MVGVLWHLKLDYKGSSSSFQNRERSLNVVMPSLAKSASFEFTIVHPEACVLPCICPSMRFFPSACLLYFKWIPLLVIFYHSFSFTILSIASMPFLAKPTEALHDIVTLSVVPAFEVLQECQGVIITPQSRYRIF